MWLLALHSVLFALVFVIDLEHRLVLNRVILVGAVLSLAGSLIWNSPPLGHALLGGVAGLALFLLIALAKPRGMGMGDVKLAGLIGLVVGYPGVFTALAVGIVTGGLGSAVLLATRRARRKSYIPYAPFLVSGAVIGLLQTVPW
jgi:leader peptidase (prepilin peptidase)/N-methyltransferase